MLPIFDGSPDCPGDPTWVLMGAYTLQAHPADSDHVDEPADVFLRALQGTCMPTQTQMRILTTIRSIATAADKPQGLQMPNPSVHIYLLRESRLQDGGGLSQEQVDGGWGYFVVERCRDVHKLADGCDNLEIELYIYQEGEGT